MVGGVERVLVAPGAEIADLHAGQEVAAVVAGLVEFGVVIEVPVGVEVVDEEEDVAAGGLHVGHVLGGDAVHAPGDEVVEIAGLVAGGDIPRNQIIVAGLFIYLIRVPREEWLMKTGLAILIGGALGNLYDRVVLGRVLGRELPTDGRLVLGRVLPMLGREVDGRPIPLTANVLRPAL